MSMQFQFISFQFSSFPSLYTRLDRRRIPGRQVSQRVPSVFERHWQAPVTLSHLRDAAAATDDDDDDVIVP